MPSGVVKLLRRLLLLRTPKEDWREEEEGRLEATTIVPTRIKLRIVDKKQIEVKVVYRLSNALQKQLYEVDVFMFFDALLEPVKVDIYSSVWRVVRLHTPKATMASLAQLHAPGSLLGAIRLSLAAATAPLHPKEAEEREGTLVRQMRLQACMFRAAVRKSTGRLLWQLRRVDAGDAASCTAAMQAAADTALLAGQTCAAIEALQQVCAGCCEDDVPEVASAAWPLVEEYVLSEAARSLLKLLAHTDAALAALPPPPALPAAEAGAAGGGAPGAQPPLQALCAEAEDVAAGLAALSVAAGSTAGTTEPGSAADPRPGQARLDGLLNGHLDILGADQELAKPAAARAAPGAGSGFGAGSPTAQRGAAQQAAAQARAAEGNGSAYGRRAAAASEPCGAAAPGGAFARPRAGTGQGSGLQLGSTSLEWVSDAPGDDGEDSPPAPQPLARARPAPPVPLRALASPAAPAQPGNGLASAPAIAPHAASRSGAELPGHPLELPSRCPTAEPIQRGAAGGNAAFEVGGGLEPSRSWDGSTGRAALGAAASRALARARMLVGRAVRACEETARRRGYAESLPRSHEAYTSRITVLKRHARAAIVLRPLVQRPSNALADVVGMVVAGTAMAVALVTTWAAQRSSNLYGVLYCMIIIVGYILKDRMKEWGKRYLQPCAEWFGFRFPDRIVRVEDQRKRVVGYCEERVSWKNDEAADARVRDARYASRAPGPTALRAAVKPERVLCYSRRTTVAWAALDPRLQGVRGLSDILRLDLDHFCRHMQPPTEAHLRLVEQEGGGFTVDSVDCPRVYHLNVVLRVRSRAAKRNTGRLMQLKSARIVADQTGILRLEPTGSGLLSRPPPPRRLANLAQPLASLARISATTRCALERALHLGPGSAPLPPVAEHGTTAQKQGGAGGGEPGGVALVRRKGGNSSAGQGAVQP